MSFVENVNLIANAIKNSIIQSTDNFLQLIQTQIITGASGGTGVSNENKTITLGGNLTTNGAFDTTLTSTGTTNITLPTTGTLVTLDGAETLSNKTLVTPNIGVATGISFNNIVGLSNIFPNMDGIANSGTSTSVARADHTHPSDTNKQDVLVSNSNIKTVGGISVLGSGDIPVALTYSPALIGTPTAPTASAGTNNTQIATTAMVHSAITNDLNVTGTAPMYACRAWVNYNGSTPVINASGNVSSVTKNGTGDYTANFTVAMPDANYVVNLTQNDALTGTAICKVLASGSSSAPTLKTTTQIRFGFGNATAYDVSNYSVSIFR